MNRLIDENEIEMAIDEGERMQDARDFKVINKLVPRFEI